MDFEILFLTFWIWCWYIGRFSNIATADYFYWFFSIKWIIALLISLYCYIHCLSVKKMRVFSNIISDIGCPTASSDYINPTCLSLWLCGQNLLFYVFLCNFLNTLNIIFSIDYFVLFSFEIFIFKVKVDARVTRNLELSARGYKIHMTC